MGNSWQHSPEPVSRGDGGGVSALADLTTAKLKELLLIETELNRLSAADAQALLAQLNLTNFDKVWELIISAKKDINVTSIDDMYVKALENYLSPYPDFQTHKLLLMYVPPFLLALGTFGNVFSFVILTRRSMRRVSTYIYLAVLSVTDTLVLYIGLLRLWVGELTESDVRDHSDWICKTINVLGYTVSDYSVWLIIAVTVERYIAVCHAFRAPTMCNRRRAVKVIIGIGVAIFAVNFHFFFTTQIRTSEVEQGEEGEDVGQCHPAVGFDAFIKFWHWVDAFIYSFLPFMVLSVLNGLIIHTVLDAKRNRGELSASKDSKSGHRNRNSPQHHGSSHTESHARLTVMLLTISFAFVITTLPMNITLILTYYWTSQSEGLEDDAKLRLFARATLIRTVTELLMYLNHSMNFFLYCATGRKFRQQLCAILCPKRHHDNGVALSIANSERTLDVKRINSARPPLPQQPLRHSPGRAVTYTPVDTEASVRTEDS